MKEKWLPLVRVYWKDACAYAFWGTSDDHASDTLDGVETVGFLLKENKTRITVAQSVSNGGKIHSVMAIPTASITRMVKLTYQRKGGKK